MAQNAWQLELQEDRTLEVTVKGIKTHYLEAGEGETVLLLHGWGASVNLYKSVLDVLEKGMHVIAPDMPGVGLTPDPECAWCVDDYLDFIIEFVRTLGIKRLSLIGHSFGGRVIIKMMSRKNLPFTVDKIVLMDSAGIRPHLSLKKRLKQRIYKISKWILSIGIVKWFYPDALDNLRNRNGSADYNRATPVMRATLVRVVNEDLTHLLPNITRPTLLIWGTKDTATPFSDAEKMNKLIPDSGIVKLEGAGHFAFAEQPATVKCALCSFFEI